MTIGIGFRCLDGIVVGADTQITNSSGHKYTESKLFECHDPAWAWTAIFTYAGTPDLMRAFVGNFETWMCHPGNSSSCSSCAGIMQIVEGVLASMSSAIKAEPYGLSTIGALSIPAANEMLMIKTSNEAVCIARDFECIGAGDSSLLRFLEPLVCCPTGMGYAAAQARLLSVYLIYQAKRYVDGCGGTTDIRVLWPHGHYDLENGAGRDIEKEIDEIESQLSIATSLSFDARVSASLLEQNWRPVIDQLKKGHA